MPTNKVKENREVVKQKNELAEQKNKIVKQKNDLLEEEHDDNKPLPETDLNTESPTPGSMSEGNLSNNEYGRERRQTPHRKMFITGSDDDGQAV